MRTTRALMATFGVSAALVAVGAFSLLALSAVVAIGGWPGLSDDAADRALVLADEVLAVPGETPAGIGLASGAVVLTEEEPEPEPGPEPGAPANVEAREPVQAPAAPAPAPVAPLEPQAPAASSDKPSELKTDKPSESQPRTGDVVRDVTGGLGDTVQGTGDALGDTTAQLSPELGQTVKDLTGLVGGTLRNTGDLLAGTVDRLLPVASR